MFFQLNKMELVSEKDDLRRRRMERRWEGGREREREGKRGGGKGEGRGGGEVRERLSLKR